MIWVGGVLLGTRRIQSTFNKLRVIIFFVYYFCVRATRIVWIRIIVKRIGPERMRWTNHLKNKRARESRVSNSFRGKGANERDIYRKEYKWIRNKI